MNVKKIMADDQRPGVRQFDAGQWLGLRRSAFLCRERRCIPSLRAASDRFPPQVGRLGHGPLEKAPELGQAIRFSEGSGLHNHGEVFFFCPVWIPDHHRDIDVDL